MNEPTSATIENLFQHVAAGPAPIDDLLSRGRSMRRRRHLAAGGGAIALALIFIVGGVVAAQSLRPGEGSSGQFVAQQPRVVRDLAVHTVGTSGSRAHELAVQVSEYGGPVWDPERHVVYYLTTTTYSSACLPEGSANLHDDSSVDLELRHVPPKPGFGCTADAVRVLATIRDVTAKPSQIRITEAGETFVAPVKVWGEESQPSDLSELLG